MADDVKSIASNILLAIDTERTDIICSVLSELRKKDVDTLHKVLNEDHTDVGTFLHYATKKGNVDKIRALLNGGADPGIQNKDGKLPLELGTDQMKSVYNEELFKSTALSNLGRVCQLLAGGVSLHIVDSPEMQNSPLHWAACHSNRDMVQCLCARGALPNLTNARGLTPLHEAVKRGEAGIVEELMNYGANPEIPVSVGENVGQTAIDLAQGKESILQAFRAPRQLLEPINSSIKHMFDSKANLVHLSSLPSEDAALNGVNGEVNQSESSSLKSPSIKHSAMFQTKDLLSSLPSLMLDEKVGLLWPPPQTYKLGGGKPFVIKEILPIFIAPGSDNAKASDIASLWNLRRQFLADIGLGLSLNLLTSLSSFESPHVMCHVNKRLTSQKGFYKLTVTPKQIKIICGDLEALNYAISTTMQLLSLYREEDETGILALPTMIIHDYPNLAYRGVLLDVSQGRILSTESLEEHIDILSLLKFNQIYLYTRFQSNLPPQWQCNYSRSEVLHLSDFCDIRHIQLIPLIEVGPKVQFEDLSKLYPVFQDFLACFSSPDFVSVGPRLSSFLLDATEDNISAGDVLRYLPISSSQTLQLCGYPLHDINTSLLQRLPPGLIFTEYSVKADHNYDKYCTPLAEFGLNYFVFPGTAAWNSLAGCPEAAICNIMSSVQSNDGAMGMVVCDWAGKGHLNHHPISWTGILTATAISWNKNTEKETVEKLLTTLLDQYVFQDRAAIMGGLILELGSAETYAIKRARNQAAEDSSDLPEELGSIFYRFLTHPDGVPLENLSTDTLQHVTRSVKKCQEALGKADPQMMFADVLKAEIQLTTDLMLLACRIGKCLILSGRKPNKQTGGYDVVNCGISNLTATNRTDLANRLLELTRQFCDVWGKRSYVKMGLPDAVQRLRSLLKVLLPESSESEFIIGNGEIEDV